jgi:hypothetical protein
MDYSARFGLALAGRSNLVFSSLWPDSPSPVQRQPPVQLLSEDTSHLHVIPGEQSFDERPGEVADRLRAQPKAKRPTTARGSGTGPLPRSANDALIEYACAAASMHRMESIAGAFS